MTDKHEVTVYDRVPATARVSVAQVQRYLYRAGWSKSESIGGPHDAMWSCRTGAAFVGRIWVSGEQIEEIAKAERRLPSAVLADIAKEPT